MKPANRLPFLDKIGVVTPVQLMGLSIVVLCMNHISLKECTFYMLVHTVTHVYMYFHFRIVGPPCVFTCAEKNKVCIWMHTNKLHTLLSGISFLSSVASLSLSLPPCSPSQTVFAQSILAQWKELSSASLDSKIKRNWYMNYTFTCSLCFTP